MKQLILLTAILLTSTVTLAEDTTTTETCANGAGIVIEGAVADANGNKHKYCISNKTMNWWNAVSWCDAMGRKLFDRANCACGNTTADCAGSMCPELKGVSSGDWVWSATPNGTTRAYSVSLSSGYIGSSLRGNHRCAVCYQSLDL